MNYLAHLYLAKTNRDSLTGNLMGDFCQGLDIKQLPLAVQLGIHNHRSIDRFTDSHPKVRALKSCLPPQLQRFSGIISDVVFDHFLALQWQQFSDKNFLEFRQHSYQKLAQGYPLMPEKMQIMVERMISQDWLSGYQDFANVDRALQGIGRRMRFANPLDAAIAPVQARYELYRASFECFFPQLIAHVQRQNIEGEDEGDES
ncbi:DUF479 domain-containing protein [Thalassotalea litorea]|uniref:DUF479 domain-containing protein n=1 Tax=Thalassotalea litorea TaxID=2020715 RepID=A0A5R9IMM8_9GAMM|nr:ACP phosphodiesterase [Thalassotalea litorea]TLU66790.1 DUF479 domain-containing protein [Thalassotalea litorea]